jgi:alkanesulfonate monooxygenase SsuD/methylene tetrahydromethanopterin reductase-like flavin-dependent oxidoreductase (luciferase family)
VTPTTQYAIVTPNYGEYGYARVLADLAQRAEANGWDGFFTWDHINATFAEPEPMVDAWVALSAMAMATERIRIGTWVTPVARRRPWKLAREAASVDQLSGGRLTLGVGLGAPASAEYGAFGEDPDARVRAQKLDEGLAVLGGLWSGEPFSFEGKHHRVSDVTFLPVPVQQPRIPVWVAGEWPHRAPFRRAARWDGVAPLSANLEWDELISVEDVRELVDFVSEQRGSLDGFDVAITGPTPADPPAAAGLLLPYVEAGMTWWLEGCHHRRGTLADTIGRIEAGPPGP